MDVLPSIRTHPVSHQEEAKKRWRTVHDELHVAQKTMNDLKRLSPGHASLIDGESVQSIEHILDLALPQQLLCKLL